MPMRSFNLWLLSIVPLLANAQSDWAPWNSENNVTIAVTTTRVHLYCPCDETLNYPMSPVFPTSGPSTSISLPTDHRTLSSLSHPTLTSEEYPGNASPNSDIFVSTTGLKTTDLSSSSEPLLSQTSPVSVSSTASPAYISTTTHSDATSSTASPAYVSTTTHSDTTTSSAYISTTERIVATSTVLTSGLETVATPTGLSLLELSIEGQPESKYLADDGTQTDDRTRAVSLELHDDGTMQARSVDGTVLGSYSAQDNQQIIVFAPVPVPGSVSSSFSIGNRKRNTDGLSWINEAFKTPGNEAIFCVENGQLMAVLDLAALPDSCTTPSLSLVEVSSPDDSASTSSTSSTITTLPDISTTTTSSTTTTLPDVSTTTTSSSTTTLPDVSTTTTLSTTMPTTSVATQSTTDLTTFTTSTESSPTTPSTTNLVTPSTTTSTTSTVTSSSSYDQANSIVGGGSSSTEGVASGNAGSEPVMTTSTTSTTSVSSTTSPTSTAAQTPVPGAYCSKYGALSSGGWCGINRVIRPEAYAEKMLWFVASFEECIYTTQYFNPSGNGTVSYDEKFTVDMGSGPVSFPICQWYPGSVLESSTPEEAPLSSSMCFYDQSCLPETPYPSGVCDTIPLSASAPASDNCRFPTIGLYYGNPNQVLAKFGANTLTDCFVKAQEVGIDPSLTSVAFDGSQCAVLSFSLANTAPGTKQVFASFPWEANYCFFDMTCDPLYTPRVAKPVVAASDGLIGDGDSTFCSSNSDCASNFCNSQHACGFIKDGGKCFGNRECFSNLCTDYDAFGGTCRAGQSQKKFYKDTCSDDSDCVSGKCWQDPCNKAKECTQKVCQLSTATRPSCIAHDQCNIDSYCNGGSCAPRIFLGSCDYNATCYSGVCNNGRCNDYDRFCQNNDDCAKNGNYPVCFLCGDEVRKLKEGSGNVRRANDEANLCNTLSGFRAGYFDRVCVPARPSTRQCAPGRLIWELEDQDRRTGIRLCNPSDVYTSDYVALQDAS